MSISREFVMAGFATFTVEVPAATAAASGGRIAPHYTYRVEHVESTGRYAESYFVSLLVGPDNTSDYIYIGKMDPWSCQMRTTAASKVAADSFPVTLFNRIIARVWMDDHAAYESFGYRTHHEGTCGRCGRPLTVPESILTGIGPVCREKMGSPASVSAIAPAVAPTVTTASAERIGNAGADKLLQLAARKGARLRDYVDPLIGKFATVDQLIVDQGRQVWRRLAALPDVNVRGADRKTERDEITAAEAAERDHGLDAAAEAEWAVRKAWASCV